MCLEFMWLWFIHWCACDMLFTAIFIASTEVLQCLSISSVNHSRMKWDLLHFIPFMYSKCSPMKNGTHFFSHCILIFVSFHFFCVAVRPVTRLLFWVMPHGRGAVYYFFPPFQIIFFLCFKDIIQAINLLMFSKRFFFRILQNIRFWWLQIGSWILSSPCYFGLFPYFLAPFPNILVFNLTATLYYFLSQINFSLISVVKYCESMGHLNSSWIHDQLTTAWKDLPYLVFQYIFHPLLFVGKSEASKCKKKKYLT